MGRQSRHQALDLARCSNLATATCSLSGGPASIEAVCRGNRENTDVAAVFTNASGGFDRLGGDAALIGDHDLGVRPRLTPPISTVDYALSERVVLTPRRLLQWAGAEAQID
jgi:hypothetical protein